MCHDGDESDQDRIQWSMSDRTLGQLPGPHLCTGGDIGGHMCGDGH